MRLDRGEEARQIAILQGLAPARSIVRPFDSLAIGLGAREVRIPSPKNFDDYIVELEGIRSHAADLPQVRDFLVRESQWVNVDWMTRLRRALAQVRMAERLGLRPSSTRSDWDSWLRSDLLGDDMALRLSATSTIEELESAIRGSVHSVRNQSPASTTVEVAISEFEAAGAAYFALAPWVSIEAWHPGRWTLVEFYGDYIERCKQWAESRQLPAPPIATIFGVRAPIDGLHIAESEWSDARLVVNERLLAVRVDELDAYDLAGLCTLIAHEGWPGHGWEFAVLSGRNATQRLIRDPMMSEGWASIAEFYPSMYYGDSIAKRAAESVMRRCAAVIAGYEGIERVAERASRFIEVDRLPRFVSAVERTVGQSVRYVLGLRYWRRRLKWDYISELDWAEALRVSSPPVSWATDPSGRGL